MGLADINTAQVQARVGGSCAVGQYVRAIAADGAVTCGSGATGTPGWALGGNAGTDPASQFEGTTDAQPLVLRTANAASLRLQPSSLTFGSPALPITSNTIAGGHANEVALGVRGATIAGGGLPSGNSDPLCIDEEPNRVTDSFGTVGGGYANRAGRDAGSPTVNPFATVGGRVSNIASGSRSTVAGGGSSLASGYASAVSGGQDNDASGDFSVVVGGSEKAAVGSSSAVGGGAFNCAGGGRSWAGGFRVKIRPPTNPGAGHCSGLPSYPGGPGDEGSFIWADYQFEDFVSTGPGQFLVRAGGGFFLNTNQTVFSPDDVVLKARPVSGDPDMDRRLVTRTNRSVNLFVSDAPGTLNVAVRNLASGANRLTVSGGSGGNAFLSDGGTWSNASSRSFRENVAAIDPLAVLDRLLALPISTWRYIGSEEGVHLGLMAEDFKAAFDLAGDGKSIATVDADGVRSPRSRASTRSSSARTRPCAPTSTRCARKWPACVHCWPGALTGRPADRVRWATRLRAVACAKARHGQPVRLACLPEPRCLRQPAGTAPLRRAGPAWSGGIAGVAAIACSRALVYAGWRPIG